MTFAVKCSFPERLWLIVNESEYQPSTPVCNAFSP